MKTLIFLSNNLDQATFKPSPGVKVAPLISVRTKGKTVGNGSRAFIRYLQNRARTHTNRAPSRPRFAMGRRREGNENAIIGMWRRLDVSLVYERDSTGPARIMGDPTRNRERAVYTVRRPNTISKRSRSPPRGRRSRSRSRDRRGSRVRAEVVSARQIPFRSGLERGLERDDSCG